MLVSTIRNAGPDWSWEVIYFLSSRDAMVPDLEALGCKVTCLDGFGIPGMFLRLPELVMLLKKKRYDLIHAHLPWSGIIGRLAGFAAGIPVIYTEHNLFSHYKGITRFFNRLTYRFQSHVIAVSGQVADAMPQAIKNSVLVTVVNNGVDLIEFNPTTFNRKALLAKAGIPQDAFVVGTVASIRPQKRIDRWLQIAESVLEKSPGIHFLLVGGGEGLDEIRSRVHAMPHGNCIHIVGLQPDPAVWLAMMQVFLMTSDYEGMPVALLEAMAMGCVPVVTPVGGIPAVVTNGSNGYFFSGEEPEKAVNIIIDLAAGNQNFDICSHEARATVINHFGIDRMVARLEKIYELVLENRTAKKND